MLINSLSTLILLSWSERLVLLCFVQGVFRMGTVLFPKALLLNVVVVVVYNMRRTVFFFFLKTFVDVVLAKLKKIHVNDNILA